MTSKVVLRAIQGFRDKRLGQFDVADLVFFWNEYESEIGIKAIDYSNVRTEGGEIVSDPLTDTVHATTRARRIRARLSQLSAAHQRVLYRVYGPWDRHAPFGKFGDLSGIVEYTTVAEEWGSRDEIEKRIQNPEHERDLRMAAEKLLWAASAAYRATR